MAQAYFEERMADDALFSLFVRRLPGRRNEGDGRRVRRPRFDTARRAQAPMLKVAKVVRNTVCFFPMPAPCTLAPPSGALCQSPV
jgi:hypothetical protein